MIILRYVFYNLALWIGYLNPVQHFFLTIAIFSKHNVPRMADAKTQLEQICPIYRHLHQLGQICPIYCHQLGHIFLSLEAISCFTSRVGLCSIGSGLLQHYLGVVYVVGC